MLSPHEVAMLLGDLCTQLGLCLPEQAQQALVEAPPKDAGAFTDAVFRAEGLDPDAADHHVYRDARAIVTKVFLAAAERGA